MKKILVASVIVLVLILVGGVVYAQGQTDAISYSGQRLFGIGRQGLMGMPPGGGAPNYYFGFNFIVANPDWSYGKTLEKIVITYGDDGTIVKEVVLTGEEAWLAPHETFEKDSEQLSISPTISNLKLYNIEVYWAGRGEPLRGWIEDMSWLVEQDQFDTWIIKDFGPVIEREMIGMGVPRQGARQGLGS